MNRSDTSAACARRLRFAIDKAGLSLQDVADLMDTSLRAVRAWTCGEVGLKLEQAIELADFLNTTVAFLAGEEAYDEPVRWFTSQIPLRRRSQQEPVDK